MANDYGYFGSGSTGYAHYMQSFNRNFGGGGGGGGGGPRRNRGGGGGGGCLTCIVAVIGIGAFLTTLIR